MTENNQLLTVKEAAAYAKMSVSRLYAKMAAGEIKAMKREGQTLIEKASIDAYNEKHLEPWLPEKERRGTRGGTKIRPAKQTL